MSSADGTKGKLQQDLFLIVQQFLLDNNFTETANRFVEEAKIYFDLDRFEALIRAGDWEEVRRYGLTWFSWDGESYSKKVIFTVMKQMYLEALGRKDYKTAIRMIYHDLTPLKTHKLDTYQQLFDLLGLDDFRENPKLSAYTTDEQYRELAIAEIRHVLERSPQFQAICKKPTVSTPKRLNTLINQALNWQHSRCGVKDNDWFNTVTSLQKDHRCEGATGMALEPSSQTSPTSQHTQPANGHANANGVKRAREEHVSPAMTPTPHAKHTKHDIPSPALSPVQPVAASPATQRHELDIPKPAPVTSAPALIANEDKQANTREQSIAVLPTHDVTYISLSSPATAVCFHPVQATLLYVATAESQLQLWNVSQSIVLQSLRVASPIKRIAIAADGSCLACSTQSKVLLFNVQPNFTLEATHTLTEHTAEVNDIKLFKVKENWHVISCSDDKTITLSNVTRGERVVQYLGHEGPVTAVAAGSQGRMIFFCSSSKDSTIRVWMLSNPKQVSKLTSPSSKWYTDLWVHEMKLFGCGVARDLLEWSTTGGTISKHFKGYTNSSESSTVKFDLLNKKFLVLSDDSTRIKFWDIADEEPLTSFDPEVMGSSSSYLAISGNSNGSLLAIGCPVAHYVKITGNPEGMKLVAKKLTKQDVRLPGENNNNNNTIAANVTQSRPPKPSIQIPIVQAAHSPAVTQSPIAPSQSSLPSLTTVNLTQSPPIAPMSQSPAPVQPMISPKASQSPLTVTTIPVPKSTPTPPSIPPLIPSNPPPAMQPNAFNMLSVKAESDPEAPINQIIFQNNGGGLLTFGEGLIRLWKWPTGQQANTQIKPDNFTTPKAKFLSPTLPATGPRYYSMSLSTNDVYLMASSGNGIQLFQTTKLEEYGSSAPGVPIVCMALNTKDNNYLATASADSVQIHAFGYNPGVVLELRSLFISKPTSVVFHNSFVAAGSEEGLLVIYKLSISESEKLGQPPQNKKYIIKSFAPVEDPLQFNLKHPIVSMSINKANSLLLVATKKSIVFVNAPERVVYTWESTLSSNITAAVFNIDYTMVFCVLEDNTRVVLKIVGTPDNPQDLTPIKVQPLDNKHGAIRCIAAHTRNPNAFAVGTQKGFFCICEFDPK